MNTAQIRDLILELMEDDAIREAIGRAIVEAPLTYMPIGISPDFIKTDAIATIEELENDQ